MGVFIGGILVVVGVVAFVLHPIVAQRSAPLGRLEDEPTEAQARKRIALMALRDVEYEFATGKLDEADYGSLKSELAAEALEAIRVEESERREASTSAGAEDRHPGAVELLELEEEIEAYRAGLRQAIACERCGGLNEMGSRFCANCGTKLLAAAGQGSEGAGEQ
jgi:hypothetical protein